jgi:hypothetical protein
VSCASGRQPAPLTAKRERLWTISFLFSIRWVSVSFQAEENGSYSASQAINFHALCIWLPHNNKPVVIAIQEFGQQSFWFDWFCQYEIPSEQPGQALTTRTMSFFSATDQGIPFAPDARLPTGKAVEMMSTEDLEVARWKKKACLIKSC